MISFALLITRVTSFIYGAVTFHKSREALVNLFVAKLHRLAQPRSKDFWGVIHLINHFSQTYRSILWELRTPVPFSPFHGFNRIKDGKVDPEVKAVFIPCVKKITSLEKLILKKICNASSDEKDISTQFDEFEQVAKKHNSSE